MTREEPLNNFTPLGKKRILVEATGFEPAASASRTQRSTKLSHASTSIYLLHCESFFFQYPCAATPLTLAVPDDSTLPYLACRPLRLFTLAVSSTGCARVQSYQTEPRLDIYEKFAFASKYYYISTRSKCQSFFILIKIDILIYG